VTPNVYFTASISNGDNRFMANITLDAPFRQGIALLP
jgi:hypothetical protein